MSVISHATKRFSIAGDGSRFCVFDFQFHTGETVRRFVNVPAGANIDVARTSIVPEVEQGMAQREFEGLING